MGCNAEQAKIKINEILTRSQIDSDPKSLELVNEKTILEIELLKKELAAKDFKSDEDNLSKMVSLLDNNLKIAKHKSNFFDLLRSESKIIKISTTLLDKDGNILIQKEVKRPDFNKYIIDDSILEPVVEKDISLEIIAPVLKRGKFKWKCYYSI